MVQLGSITRFLLCKDSISVCFWQFCEDYIKYLIHLWSIINSKILICVQNSSKNDARILRFYRFWCNQILEKLKQSQLFSYLLLFRSIFCLTQFFLILKKRRLNELARQTYGFSFFRPGKFYINLIGLWT